MVYEIMEPPLGGKDCMDMTKEEAKIYFEWYTAEIPKRLDMLKKAFMLKNKEDIFDFSQASLIPLWSWYLENVNIVPLSRREYAKEKKELGKFYKTEILKEKIEIGWVQVALDIGIYVSECFLKKSNKLKWGYVTKPKRLVGINSPVILGFNDGRFFDHTNKMSVQTYKILDKESTKNSLFEIFEIWKERIPPIG